MSLCVCVCMRFVYAVSIELLIRLSSIVKHVKRSKNRFDQLMNLQNGKTIQSPINSCKSANQASLRFGLVLILKIKR